MRTTYTAKLSDYQRQVAAAVAQERRVYQAALDVGADVFQDEIVFSDQGQADAFLERVEAQPRA